MSDPIRATLEDLMAKHGRTYADLSALLGRNPAYMHQYMKRGTPRRLAEDDRRVLARFFNVDEADLGGVIVASESAPSPDALPVVTIPRIALGVSAGVGTLVNDEAPTGAVAFDAAWLRALGVRPQACSIIRVEGDSMVPTLAHGDEIMVDCNDAADQLRDGVYVLRLDGLLMVKRVVAGPRRGRFAILSDNPYYPDWPDADPELVAIIGRVAWTGRRVR